MVITLEKLIKLEYPDLDVIPSSERCSVIPKFSQIHNRIILLKLFANHNEFYGEIYVRNQLYRDVKVHSISDLITIIKLFLEDE